MSTPSLNPKDHKGYRLTGEAGEAMSVERASSPHYVLTCLLDYQYYGMHDMDKVLTHEVLHENFAPLDHSSMIEGTRDRRLTAYQAFWQYKKRGPDSLHFVIWVTPNVHSLGDVEDYEVNYLEEQEETYRVSHVYYLSKRGHWYAERVVATLNLLLRDKEPKKGRIHMVMPSGTGFVLEDFKLDYHEVDIETHYNSGFDKVHESMANLLEERDKGLILLHGDPGTGKTNYLKWLTSQVEQQFIFVPTHMVPELERSAFISLIHAQEGCVLVLEDCETYIEARKLSKGNEDFVSMLLNITDGMLSDILKVKVICTFNTNRQAIDEALLREGRLLLEYRFGKLAPAKADNLLGIRPTTGFDPRGIEHPDPPFSEPTSLAEVMAKVGGTEAIRANTVEMKKVGF